MVNIKKIKDFVTSKSFLFPFFYFLLFSTLSFGLYKTYQYIEKKQNIAAFALLYDILERYQAALESNSKLPLEELFAEITAARKKLGYFSSLKSLFDQLSYEAESFISEDKKLEMSKIKLSSTIHPFDFLFMLFSAIDKATSKIVDVKHEGLSLLKKLSDIQTPFRDVALFYYGYLLLKTTSLKQADEAWYPLLYDPLFNQSLYKELVSKARNLDF